MVVAEPLPCFKAYDVALYGVDSVQLGMEMRSARSGDTVDVQFSLGNTLALGTYYLNCGVRYHTASDVEFLSHRTDSAILRVTAGPRSTAAVSLVEMKAKIKLRQASDFGMLL